jgi:hypothetical protein
MKSYRLISWRGVIALPALVFSDVMWDPKYYNEKKYSIDTIVRPYIIDCKGLRKYAVINPTPAAPTAANSNI